MFAQVHIRTFLFVLLSLQQAIVDSFIRNPTTTTKYNSRHLSMVYEGQVDPKDMMRKSEIVIAIPTSVPMQQIGELKKLLPPSLVSAVVGSKRIIEAADSTPFCTLASSLPNILHLLLFLESKDGREYEAVMKWIRSVQQMDANSPKNLKSLHTIMIAKKGHLIRLEVCL